MKRLKQLFENLVYLSKVDIKQREKIIDEVRNFLTKPRTTDSREAEAISRALKKEHYYKNKV